MTQMRLLVEPIYFKLGLFHLFKISLSSAFYKICFVPHGHLGHLSYLNNFFFSYDIQDQAWKKGRSEVTSDWKLVIMRTFQLGLGKSKTKKQMTIGSEMEKMFQIS